MSYHAMSGIYPSVVVFLSLLMFIENEDINKILNSIDNELNLFELQDCRISPLYDGRP